MTALGAIPASTDLSLTNDVLPAGAIMGFAGAVPAGWLACDGASYLRASYNALFTALGGASSPYGLPDGTHFNVPNLTGRAPVGKSGGSMAATGGALDHQHGAGTLAVPAHTHGAGDLAVGSHTHGAGTLAMATHYHVYNDFRNTNIVDTTPGMDLIIGVNDSVGSDYATPGVSGSSGPATSPALTGTSASASASISGSVAAANAAYGTVNYGIKT